MIRFLVLSFCVGTFNRKICCKWYLVENWFCSDYFGNMLLAHHNFTSDGSLMFFMCHWNCKIRNFMYTCIWTMCQSCIGKFTNLVVHSLTMVYAHINICCAHIFTYKFVCTYFGTMVCAHIYVRSREAISSSGPSMGGLNRPQEGVPLSDKRLFFVLRNADFRFRFSSCTQIAIWSLCHILSG